MRSILAVILLSLFAVNARSQVLEKTFQKLSSYQNITYCDVLKIQFSFQESANVDTNYVEAIQIAGETQIGGYFKVKNKVSEQIFDGKKSITLSFGDSTYRISNDAIISQYSRNLLFWKKQIGTYLKTPSHIKKLADTLIHDTSYYHVHITVFDSLKNNNYTFELVDLIIDKQTFL